MYTTSQTLASLAPSVLKALLLEHGAVLIRSQASSRNDVEAFLNFSQNAVQQWGQFIEQGSGSQQQRSIGGNSGRSCVQGLSSLFTTTGAYAPHPVPLHGELYFQQLRPPEMLWFYCQQPPQRGGETLLCDGERIFAGLPADTQAVLSSRKLVYQRHLDAQVWPRLYGTEERAELSAYLSAQGYTLDWLEDGSVRTQFTSPAVLQRDGRPVFINNLLPFGLRQWQTPNQTRARIYWEGDSEPLPEALVLQIEAVAQALTLALAWEPGDIVVVDNTRMLHGRHEVQGSEREIYVRMNTAQFLADLLDSNPI